MNADEIRPDGPPDKGESRTEVPEIHNWKLALLFSISVFVNITVGVCTAAAVMIFLYYKKILTGPPGLVPYLIFAGISIVMGTGLSRLVSRRIFRIGNDFIEATREVARGNFDVRLKEDYKIEEVRTLAANFNRMTEELARTELFRNDFVENVSHEFKTPLSAIEGYAMLLQKKDLPEEKRREYTERILSNTRSLSSLSSNILLLSRVENQELEIRRTEYLLDEQIRKSILYFEELWSRKHLELDLDLEECRYAGNADLLVHVWLNLIENAIKFSPEGGTLHIRLRAQKDSICFVVRDEGPGITAEDRQRIFEKFYKGDRSRNSEGNGLGLALVKRIVDLHGGSVQVESEPGQGAAFTVELPCIPGNSEIE